MHPRTPLPGRLSSRFAAAAMLLAAAALGCAATPSATPAIAPDPLAPVQAAIADAARQTGVAAADIQVVSVENVTWLDGSLGCPEPDMMYTQALVPGYRIHIEAGGKLLDYHADAHGQLLQCPPERAVAPAATGAAGSRP